MCLLQAAPIIAAKKAYKTMNLSLVGNNMGFADAVRKSTQSGACPCWKLEINPDLEISCLVIQIPFLRNEETPQQATQIMFLRNKSVAWILGCWNYSKKLAVPLRRFYSQASAK
jgi:hypothetical protein